MRIRSSAFVGRESEVATLRDVLRAAAGRSGSSAFVTGEAGIGKSRLLLEVFGDAAEAGMPVLRGRGSTIGPAVPYRPLQEAVLAAARIVGPSVPAELHPYRYALARLVPEWATGEHGEVSVVILGEAILRLSALLGQRGGCVLALDDLHDADPETLAVVEYLASNLSAQPVALLATTRSGPSRATELARTVCGRGEGVLLPLGRLGERDTRELIVSRLGAAGGTASGVVGGGTVDGVVRDSAGNPFIAEELLHGMIAAGELVHDDHGWRPTERHGHTVPPTVASATRARVRKLGARTARLLSTAAVLGPRFPLSVLQRLLDLDDRTLIDCVQDAVDAQVLGPDDRTIGWYAFQHPLMTDALRGGVLPEERAELSRAAAEVIAEHLDDQPSECWELASRLWVAGGDVVRAARIYLRVARRAAGAGASDSAVALLDEAREILGNPGSSIQRRSLLRDLLQALLFALADAGQFDRAAQVARDLTLRFVGDDPGRRIDLHLRLAWAAQVAGRQEDGDTQVAAARELAPGVATEEQRASLDAVAAYLAVLGRDPARMDRCERLARAAVARAERNSLPSIASQAWYAVGIACRDRDLTESDSCFRRVLDLSATHHDARWHSYALIGLGGNAWLATGDPAALRRAHDEALGGGMISLAQNTDAVLGLAAVLNGDFDAAERQLDACLTTTRRLRLASVTRYVLMAKVVLAAHRARRDDMLDALTEFARFDGEDSAEAPLAHGLGRAFYALLTEDRGAAEVELVAVATEENLRQCPFHLAGTSGLAVLLAVLDHAADGDRVRTVAARAAGTMRWNRQFLALAGAVLAGRAGRHDQVVDAVADARSAGAPFGVAWHLGLRLIGEAAVDEGWGDPAAWLQEAEEYFHRCCPAPVEAACRTLLRRLGKTPQRRRDGFDRVPVRLRRAGVTVREFEVFSLLGERLSNKALAARLHISPRTVEKHVASLLTKTGVEHREELAELGLELGTSPRGGSTRRAD